MFSTFGLLEPNNDLQIAYFGCVIALYFLTFFYDHPVQHINIKDYFYSQYHTCFRKPYPFVIHSVVSGHEEV